MCKVLGWPKSSFWLFCKILWKNLQTFCPIQYVNFLSHRCCSVAKSYPALCNSMDAAWQGSLSFTTSWSLLKLMSIELVMPSNLLILCHPLLLCPQFFPTSGSFPKSWLFTLGGHSIRTSASVLPMNSQG